MSMKSSPSRDLTGGDPVFVLFPGALGDFICLLPALQLLARQYRVHLFARAEFSDLAPETVWVRSLERYEISRLFAPGAAAEDRVRRFFAAYAHFYSWMASGQKDFVGELARVSNDRARTFPFNCSAPGVHQADYYVSCIKPGGDVPLPEIALRPEALAWSGDFWTRHGLEGRPVMALGPGSGARGKNWPIERFFAVADWWRGTVGGEVVSLLGPVEVERGGFESLEGHALIVRNLDLARVAALIQRSDIYLGNDSGITHLSAALGVPTIALFGSTDARKWRPRGKRVTVVQPNAGQAGPGGRVKQTGEAALDQLGPAQVIASIEKAREVASLTR
jgi:ADP-heptose:LPS heptosyltransferase